MRKLIIKLNHLPAPQLSPNQLRRTHWTVRSNVMGIAKTEAAWLAKQQWIGQEPMSKARVSYEFFVKGKRRHDLDNFVSAMKAVLDGIVTAGVMIDDDMAHMEFGYIRASYSDRDETIILVEELA